jgi:hypothetical protein
MALLSWIVFTVAIGLIKPPPHSCWREMNATHQSIERVGYSTSTTKANIKINVKRQATTTLPTISLKNLNKTKEIIDQNKANPLIKNLLNSTSASTTRRRRTTVTTKLTTIKTTQRYQDDDDEDDDIDSNEEDDSIKENRKTTPKSNKKPSDSNILHINTPQKTIGNPIAITLTNLSLVKPLASPVLYDKKDVRNVFMVFLLLIIIGEFFSAPAIALAVSQFFIFFFLFKQNSII